MSKPPDATTGAIARGSLNAEGDLDDSGKSWAGGQMEMARTSCECTRRVRVCTHREVDPDLGTDTEMRANSDILWSTPDEYTDFPS